uniref:Hflx-type G domain-containing protein n=1 Tax=Glossina palpalis gambiensis TaxID=67801 RepID=A0A1B0C4K9_9MUSC
MFVINVARRLQVSTRQQYKALIITNTANTATPRLNVNEDNFKRFKYTRNIGVKGLRSSKHHFESKEQKVPDIEEKDLAYENDSLNLEDSEYEEVVNGAMHLTRNFQVAHSVLIIQPYVKWGPKRNMSTSPDDQLKEAEALVNSLPNWHVALSLKVPLESLERKALFGKGKLEELKNIVNDLRQAKGACDKRLTCLFVSKGSLSFAQKSILESYFNLPVLDRYSIVIQILRLHATSAEARIQVAMAELPYIWAQAKDANLSKSRRVGWSLTDTQKEILRTRERKLKQELERIRNHRKLLRNKRKQNHYPIVAVVGYTNAGKTSLIKALTKEQSMQPKDQLFATLDVTAHAGLLPCNLKIIYMDTVGFMSDIPTGLIECFIATLEDAMLADVILHVQDVSHSCYQAQKEHVEKTLESLTHNLGMKADEIYQLPQIINVANKIDLLQDEKAAHFDNLLKVSCKNLSGLEELSSVIEKNILEVTARRQIIIKVRNGGPEMAWLYKNATVVSTQADQNEPEFMLIDVIITEISFAQFKRYFCH